MRHSLAFFDRDCKGAERIMKECKPRDSRFVKAIKEKELESLLQQEVKSLKDKVQGKKKALA